MHEAADTQEKKLEPKFELQEIGPCKLKLKVEVSAAKVKEHIEEKYKELNDTVALPGFRKGHAPRNLLERKFGKAVLDDLKGDLLSHSFEEVKEEKKLEPVGEPEIDVEKLAVEEGKPFSYELTIEVRPQFDIKGYEGVKVKKPKITVDEKEIELVLRNFQESKAELTPSPDAAARENDHMTSDFELVVDGKSIDKAENNALFLNADISFYGLALKEFYKAIVGHKVGESIDYTVTLPEQFRDKAYAGKEAILRTTLKSIKRKKLPEINAEFAKSLDMDSVDELKEHVRKRLEREKEAQGRSAMAEEIVQHLVKANDFAMPEGLVNAGTEEALQRLHLNLAMEGVAEEKVKETLEKERTQSRESMAKALKTHFILENIAQKEKVFVTEDQVEERVGHLAAQYGKWPHEMKAYLEQQGLLTQLRRQMREEQVREFLLSKAVVEEEK